MATDTILALDSATKTGWAIYKNGKIIKHGTKTFRPKTRVADYGRWLKTTIEQNEVTTIVAEDIYREHNRMKDEAFLALAQLQGALMYISSVYEMGLNFLNPLLVKNHMIPSFRAHERTEDKKRMINRVKRLGYQLESDKADDEADAIGILITYLNNRNLPVIHPNQ